MAMQIEFEKDYTQVCTYKGKVNNKYGFTVQVHWDTVDRKYIIKVVEFSDDLSVNFDKHLAIKRIKSLIKGWHYDNE